MKKRVLRDINKRLVYKLLETDNLIIKSLRNNRILNMSMRTKLIPSPARITEIRNICRVTGRTRGIIRSLGLSHLQFRLLADNGHLAGWRRATW